MYVGIDIGATKTLVGLFEGTGELLRSQKFTTPAAYPDWLTHVQRAILSLKPTHLKAIGCGVPCALNEDAQVVSCSNLPWQNSDLAEDMAKHFRVPVKLANDTALGGLAEARIGAGVGYPTLLYISLSTGVGTAIIIDGQLHPSLNHSEAGQMIIRYDHHQLQRLEDLVSGPAVIERFGKPGYELLDQGAWDTIADELAVGIFNMVSLINPGVVVVGGGMAVHFDTFAKRLLSSLEGINPGLYSLPEIKQAKYVETAAIYGAYLLAKDPKQP